MEKVNEEESQAPYVQVVRKRSKTVYVEGSLQYTLKKSQKIQWSIKLLEGSEDPTVPFKSQEPNQAIIN